MGLGRTTCRKSLCGTVATCVLSGSAWSALIAVYLLSARTTLLTVQAASLASENDLAAMSLEELSSMKIASVYGASKHEQKLTEAPASVTLVTADEIKKSGVRTLAEVLNSVRGFYTTSDRAYNYLGVRGFGPLGDYGGRTLITVNGHRMNDPIFDSSAVGWDAILDVDLIERVEVIRGPGSSLYGNNAFFGVINIVTKQGRDLGGTQLAGSYSSFDTETARVTFGNHFTNGLDLVLSGTFGNTEGHDSLFFPEFHAVNGGYAEKIDHSQFGNGFVSISYRDFSLAGGYVRRDRTIPSAPYGAVFNDARSEILDERAFTELKYHHTFDDDWDLTVAGSFDHYQFEGSTPEPELAYGDPAYPGQSILNHDHAQSESAGLEARISKTLFDQHRLTAGTEYRHDFSLEQRNFDLDPTTVWVSTKQAADTVGVYLQDEFSVLPNLILNGGLRYDYFSSFGDTINPRLATIYSPWANTTFKLIYGQAFRAPNAYELYYEAPGYLANHDLQPESIRSYELVLEQGLTRILRMSASLFYNDVRDLIAFSEDLSTSTWSFDNVSGATAQGAELELSAVSEHGWRGQVGYTFVQTRDSETDQRLSNSPEHLAKLSLTAPIWHDRIFGTFQLMGTGPRWTVHHNSTPAFWLANATLFSRELLPGLELSASVYNLFDQHYRDPVGADFLQETIAQDGRAFRVKLAWRF